MISVKMELPLVLLSLCFVTANADADECYFNSILKEIDAIYVTEHENNSYCNIYIPANSDDVNVFIVTFYARNLMINEIGLYDVLKVYDGKISTGIQLAELNRMHTILKNTSYSSRGNGMTIVYSPSKFAKNITLTIIRLNYTEDLYDHEGDIGNKVFPGEKGLSYPINAIYNLTIHPYLRCSTVVDFYYIDIAQSDQLLISYDGNVEQVKMGQKQYHIPETSHFSILLRASPNSCTGKGFKGNYSVCFEKSSSPSGYIGFPYSSLMSERTRHSTRCAYFIGCEHGQIAYVSIAMQNTSDSSYVEIYDKFENPQLIATLSQSEMNGTETYAGLSNETVIVFTNYQNYLGISMDGNYSTQGEGCTVPYQGENRTIDSTTYSGKYPNNFRCNYTITAEENSKVVLYFYKLDIGVSSEESGDYIRIYETGSLKKLVNDLHPIYFSNKNKVTVSFTTDAQESHTGFSLLWSTCGNQSTSNNGTITTVARDNSTCLFNIIPEDAKYLYVESLQIEDGKCSENDLFTCLGKTGNLTRSTRNVYEFPVGINTTLSIRWTGCPQVFSKASGTIHSHGYPLKINKEMNCTYRIQNIKRNQLLWLNVNFNVTQTTNNSNSSYFKIETDSFSSDSKTYPYTKTLYGNEKQILKANATSSITMVMFIAPGDSGTFQVDYGVIQNHTDIPSTTTSSPNNATSHMTSPFGHFPLIPVASAVGASVFVLMIVGVVSYVIKRKKVLPISKTKEAESTAAVQKRKPQTSTYSEPYSDVDLDGDVEPEDSPYTANVTYDISGEHRPHKKEVTMNVYDSNASVTYSQVNKAFTKKDMNTDYMHMSLRKGEKS